MNETAKKILFVGAFALSVGANGLVVLKKCMTRFKTYSEKMPEQKLHPRASLQLIQTDPSTWLATGRNAAIPQYSGGRLGDTLLTVAQTLYFCLKNSCDMLYIPFPYSEHFVLDEAVRQYTPELAQHFKHTYTFKGSDNASLEEPLKNTLITVPWFPEAIVGATKGACHYFFTDWEDPTFKSILRTVLAPKKSLPLITPPGDKISVAVHVRKGGTYESWGLSFKQGSHLHKIPFNEFYSDQIKSVSALLGNRPLYVFIFTDDENPGALLEKIKQAVNIPSIEYDCRRANNHHNTNVLEDFYSMQHFDVLIRPDSNYSILAEKLGEHSLVIYPGEFKKGLRVQTGLFKIRKPLQQLLEKYATRAGAQ